MFDDLDLEVSEHLGAGDSNLEVSEDLGDWDFEEESEDLQLSAHLDDLELEMLVLVEIDLGLLTTFCSDVKKSKRASDWSSSLAMQVPRDSHLVETCFNTFLVSFPLSLWNCSKLCFLLLLLSKYIHQQVINRNRQ